MASHGHGHGHHGGDNHPSPDLLARMGYETRDVAPNTLVRWVFFLFAFIAATSLFTMGLYNFFVPKDGPSSGEVERTAPMSTVRRLPPHPQVQAAPMRDMMEFRQAENAQVLEPSQNANGSVNLPVQRAMELLANERGIAGIRGSQTAPVPNAYPGSGVYGSAVLPADDSGGHDASHHQGGTNALHEGVPGAGNTTGAGGTEAQDSRVPSHTPLTPSGPAASPASGTTPVAPAPAVPGPRISPGAPRLTEPTAQPGGQPASVAPSAETHGNGVH